MMTLEPFFFDHDAMCHPARYKRYKRETVPYDTLFLPDHTCGFRDAVRYVLPNIPKESVRKSVLIPEDSLVRMELMQKLIRAHLERALARSLERHAKLLENMHALCSNSEENHVKS
jgi:hypothetical protein